MLRSRLIELAQQYYTIAICEFFDLHTSALSATIFAETKIDHSPTFRHVLRWLVSRNMLVEVKDDFAPTFFQRTNGFRAEWDRLQRIPNSVYAKYASAPDNSLWLSGALIEV